MSYVLQPFRGLPFIEAGAGRAGVALDPLHLQPFRGLPFIEAGPPSGGSRTPGLAALPGAALH